MNRPVPSYRVSLRLYVVFSLLMAAAAAASGLLLLYLARPFISELGGERAVQATALLFAGAGLSGAAAAVAGLVIGLRHAGRFRGVPILSPAGVFPLAKGNEALARLLGQATARQHSAHMSEVSATSATDQPLLLEVTLQHREWGSDSTAVVLLFRDASEKQRI